METWRKSSYSGSSGGNCVEVADTTDSGIKVRDTTDRGGVTLSVSAGVWSAFLGSLR
jgi:hypothetical protein